MKALIAIFTDPRAVFDEQSEESKWLVPALVILAFSVISAVAVMMLVDVEAAGRAQVEQSIQALERQGTPQEVIDQVRAQSEQQLAVGANPVVAIGGAVLGAIIVFFVLAVVHALYFMIVGKIMNTGHDFSDWFALAVWGRMPWVIVAIVTVVAALVMSEQTDVTAYNLLAFSTWLELPNQNSVILGQFVRSLDLMVIWSIVIMTIGFDNWTERGIGVSAAVVAIPYVVIYALLMLLPVPM